eukprot:5931647-Pleurochrysis_carterae.AAC.1
MRQIRKDACVCLALVGVGRAATIRNNLADDGLNFKGVLLLLSPLVVRIERNPTTALAASVGCARRRSDAAAVDARVTIVIQGWWRPRLLQGGASGAAWRRPCDLVGTRQSQSWPTRP